VIDWLNGVALFLALGAVAYVTVYAGLIAWIMYIHS
jgi:hypothetical protein